MYSINTFTKKKYITPVIEFEMMEEEVSVMAGTSESFTGSAGNTGEGGEGDWDPEAKRSDFIFDDNWSAEQSDISNENNGAW